MKNIDKPKEDKRERIHLVTKNDLDFSYFCGSGAGGQARNKVASGVQVLHRESGAIGRASDTRSQHDNKMAAFVRMTKTAKFKFWLARRLHEIRNEETLEQTIAKECREENLRFEIKDAQGRWEVVPSSYFDGPAAKEESKP